MCLLNDKSNLYRLETNERRRPTCDRTLYLIRFKDEPKHPLPFGYQMLFVASFAEIRQSFFFFVMQGCPVLTRFRRPRTGLSAETDQDPRNLALVITT